MDWSKLAVWATGVALCVCFWFLLLTISVEVAVYCLVGLLLVAGFVSLYNRTLSEDELWEEFTRGKGPSATEVE